MKNNSSTGYSFSLLLGDIAAILLSFAAAFVIRSGTGPDVAYPIPATTYGLFIISLLPLWILVFALLGLYSPSIYERRFHEVGRLFVGSLMGIMMMVFWDYMSLETIFPAKLVPIYAFGIAYVLLLSLRSLIRIARTAAFNYGIGLTNVVIIGNTPITAELVDSLGRGSGYNIIGVVGCRKRLPGRVASYPNFEAFVGINKKSLHAIVQTELYPNEANNAAILTYAQEHHASYRFVPGNSELFVGNIDVDLFRGAIPVLQVHHTALFGWGRLLKRAGDILFGGALLLLSLPILLFTAVIVKLSDISAPVVYRAKRMSRYGSTVHIYKFRSLKQAYNNMSPEAGFAKLGQPDLVKAYRKNGDQLEYDPRISRIGQFLRATSIDELPQLWNVLRGDISLVGPRALDIAEIEKYDKKNLILSVKSGLTGLAIVSGRHAMSFEERRKLDLYYVQNWSFWLDIVILIKTIRVVLERLFRRGSRYEEN